ncbi:MAG: DNA topology modulation protein [Alphaproteobacteria bacterium 16-39-46]|nr:MAG: DNA topology modulation protein [Alphaproteobacteria bacterium 16-39-46]OZA41803.1 MAG: DNA topology modulation protein [Alphaproteobacteria bacterium 17-39-52]
MIFGRPGSGKSTFALKLHKATKLPLHHLDKHFFEENWIERDYQEFLNIQQALVDQEAWIIDGNSLKSLEMRYGRADTALYFNFPIGQCYWRVFKRLFDKNPEIDDRAEGCRETVKMDLLRYIWRVPKRVALYLDFLRETYPNVRFIEIKSKRDLKKLEQEFLK